MFKQVRKSILGSRRAKTRKTVYYGTLHRLSNEQIRRLLAEQGIKVKTRSIVGAKVRMRSEGILPKPKSLASRIRQLLRQDPLISNARIRKLFAGEAISATNLGSVIAHARKETGIQNPRPRKFGNILPYPELTAAQIKILEEAVKPLRAMSRIAAWKKKIIGDRAEDFYSHCLERLPRWVSKIKSRESWKSFLRKQIDFALKNFIVETTMQETGMSQREVTLGFRLLKHLAEGLTLEEAARKEKTSIKDCKEIVTALGYRRLGGNFLDKF